MRLNKLLTTSLITSSLALSPAVIQAKNDVSNEVFQLVGKTLIPTDEESIKRVKFYDCRSVKGYKVYLSTRENII